MGPLLFHAPFLPFFLSIPSLLPSHPFPSFSFFSFFVLYISFPSLPSLPLYPSLPFPVLSSVTPVIWHRDWQHNKPYNSPCYVHSSFVLYLLGGHVAVCSINGLECFALPSQYFVTTVQLKVTSVEVMEEYFNVIANRYSPYSASLDNGISAVRYQHLHNVKLFSIGLVKTAVRTGLCFLYRTAELLRLIG